MSYSVKLLPAVRQDLQAAKKWYNDRKNNLGEEFKAEVESEIYHIGRSPQHYQLKYKNLRQSMIRRFPYSIFYLVEEEKKQVVIFGILHSSRDPETILKRRKDGNI